MAATSTNKQPLLVDRVLHYVVDLNTAAVAAINVEGTNTAILIVDGTQQDGAIIEDIYTIARGNIGYDVNLYLSSANDYLRPNQAIFIGTFKSNAVKGKVLRWDDMPKSLAPVPQVGTDAYNRALYIPKGRSLWAARQGTGNVTDGPILGCQGGWY